MGKGEKVLQWAFVCLMLLVLGGGLSLGGHLLEEKREFCLTCHEMKPLGEGYYASGANRHHQNCLICHSGPGVLGALGAQMTGIRELLVHAVGTPHPAGSFVGGIVPNENCLKCHTHGYDRAAHEGFPAKEKSCALCHNHYKDASFGGEVPLGTFPTSNLLPGGDVMNFLKTISYRDSDRHAFLGDLATPFR